MKTLAWTFFTMTFMAFIVLFFLTWLFNNAVNLRLHSVNDRMINKRGAAGGIRLRIGSQSAWRKSASLHPPQISYDLTWNEIPATIVGSQQLIP
jgi:hypothetical protein